MSSDPERVQRLVRAGSVFGAPLSIDRAEQFVSALALAPGRHVLDIGCGRAELLLRVVSAHPASTGTGVDRDRELLHHGRREAARRGLHERVELVEGDPATFDDHGDLVLCVGAAQVFGATDHALRRFRELVLPGGRALVGTPFWERPPGAVARTAHGDLPVYDGVVALARSVGFAVLHDDRSTLEEWDAFESSARTVLEADDTPEAQAAAFARKRTYEQEERGVLGFAWLVLRPSD